MSNNEQNRLERLCRLVIIMRRIILLRTVAVGIMHVMVEGGDLCLSVMDRAID